MANARSIDIKLKFDPTDMTPGAKGRKFRRDVLLHGGRTDARGYSITDCILRQDEGALVGPARGIVPGAVGAAGAPAGLPVFPVGNNAEARQAAACRRARLKDGFTFIVSHVLDENTLTIVGDPTGPMFQDAPEVFEYICGQIVVPPTTGEIRGM